MEPALLLNATYEPLSIVSWQKAITLMLLGKAEMLEPQGRAVHSASSAFELPSVLRLYSRVKVPRRAVQFTRGNVYRRDGHTCQYCVRKYPVSMLTFDHVLPRSRGGQTTWENIVTSCEQCNRSKGDRTPLEAGLTLKSKPREPRWWPFSAGSWDYIDYQDRWKTYMWS